MGGLDWSETLGIHIIVQNLVLYSIIRLYNETGNVNGAYRNVVYRNVIKKKPWFNHPFIWDNFPPMGTSTWYNAHITGRGLARPPGQNARRLSLIQIMWPKCAISSFNTNYADSTSILNKKFEWLPHKTLSLKTIMWVLYWYNVIQNVVSFLYYIVS